MFLQTETINMKAILIIFVSFFEYVSGQRDIAGISEAAAELYQKCANESTEKNIILSPFSISNAMALLSLGSQGKTYQQIVHGMHLDSDRHTTAAQFVHYFDALNKSRGDTTISIVNQIYTQSGHAIKKAFQTIAVDYFKSGIESINFNDPLEAANTINSFVSNKTNHKIENIIEPNAIDGNTGLVLINVLNFKGDWEYEFDASNTFQGDFYGSGAKQRKVSYIKDDQNYRYVELDDINAKAIELRFIDSEMAFVVVLPNNPNGLSTLETQLRHGNFSKIIEKMNYECVQLAMPKFQIEYEIDLENVLRQLGIIDMFEDSADFGGIFESNESIQVSKITHKAFIDVNEYGVEAAASILSGFEFNSLSSCPPVTKNFTADHPFLFHIMDVEKHIMLFSGRYMGPSH